MDYGSASNSCRMAAVLMLLSIPAYGAQSVSEVDKRLRYCMTVADADERLQCFEALAEERLDQPDQPRRSTRKLPASEIEPRVAVTAEIVRVEERTHGERVFYLSNGQVWEEIEAGRGRYRKNSQVRIEQAALGSFMLRADGMPASRVRQIR